MAIKHNQQIPHNHFRKDWARRVRCHFDQPGKKLSRRIARRAKAAKLAPRPVDRLRPVVRCPTIRYNRRVRLGRGFSLVELKAAGISRHLAATVGIVVDGRRRNVSEEGLAANVARLKEYKQRLILFPRNAKKPKKLDSKHTDLSKTDTVASLAASMAIVPADKTVKEVKKSAMPKPIEGGGAFRKLRISQSDARLVGVREKRAKEKAEAEANKKA